MDSLSEGILEHLWNTLRTRHQPAEEKESGLKIKNLIIPTRNRFAKKCLIAVYGITQSKQLCIRKPAKTEYK